MSEQDDPIIPKDVDFDLPRLRNSYLEKTGSSFTHFFCPFMHKDEMVHLCMGHVIPESFKWCQIRVTQRKDIDNFYGAHAEKRFGSLIRARGRGWTWPEILQDRT